MKNRYRCLTCYTEITKDEHEEHKKRGHVVVDFVIQDKQSKWHWPFLRVNFGGDKEYSCPHGVGHGGIHGCCKNSCCRHKSFEKRMKENN